METLYIAGPMTGLPEFNYPAFHAAESDLARKGYTVVSPARNTIGRPGEADMWEQYMRISVAQIAAADGIAYLSGWERSRGAAFEIFLATQLGLVVMPLTGWLRAAP